MMRNLCLAAAIGLSASSAFAQPATIDLGPITAPGTATTVSVISGGVTWIKFIVAEASPCLGTYIDIDTADTGSFLTDTEIALYDAAGNFVEADDDDGPSTFSALSFGTPEPARLYGVGAQPGNGRDGGLLAGTYYLAVAEFNCEFLETEWTTIPDFGGFGGSVTVNFRLGSGSVPVVPPSQFSETTCAGDAAGPLPASSLAIRGSGPLDTIRGRVNTKPDVDVYRICVTDAANFSASTLAGTSFDTELFLFNATGHGVTLNDDAPGGEVLQSLITSEVVFTTGNGEYFLAVSGFNREAVDSSGLALWSGDVPGEHLPDGPGAANPVAGWLGDVVYAYGAYVITLTGASFCPPACGSADFNGDGDTGTDSDIEAFFACLGGDCCATCGSADFDADGDTGTDADIEAFFRVLGGGTC